MHPIHFSFNCLNKFQIVCCDMTKRAFKTTRKLYKIPMVLTSRYSSSSRCWFRLTEYSRWNQYKNYPAFSKQSPARNNWRAVVRSQLWNSVRHLRAPIRDVIKTYSTIHSERISNHPNVFAIAVSLNTNEITENIYNNGDGLACSANHKTLYRLSHKTLGVITNTSLTGFY